MKYSSFNILHITSRADIGGGPKHLYLLAKGVTTNANYDTVKVYIASPSEKPYGPLFNDIATKHMKIPKRKFSILTLYRLIWFCKRNKISVVHSHGFGAGLYSRLLFFFGLKVVHTFHGIHLTKGLLGKVKLVIDKLLLGLTHKCICVSEDEKEKVCKLLNLNLSKAAVIYNGTDLDPIQKVRNLNKVEVRKDFLYKLYKPSKEKLIIGTLSRLCCQKGLDILLNYIYKYKTSHEALPFDLYITGGGEDKSTLENQRDKLGLQDNVIFLGNMDEPYLFLKSLDLFVSTSRWEGMPYSVIEAMALNIPVLLSDVTGHRMFEKHDLFDLENFASFETKLNNKLEAIKHKNIVNNKEFLERFSLDKMINKTLNLYETVAN